jgi:hypothetical protein
VREHRNRGERVDRKRRCAQTQTRRGDQAEAPDQADGDQHGLTPITVDHDRGERRKVGGGKRAG